VDDTVGTMIDRHNYGGGGEGGHGIKEGKVNNESHLGSRQRDLTIGMKQVETKPFSVSEWTQSAPNQWKVEAAPIFAFYGMALQGGTPHFTSSKRHTSRRWLAEYVELCERHAALHWAISRARFCASPRALKESLPIAARRLKVEDLFAGTDPLKQDFTKGGYDIKTLVTNGGTPAEAFAIGRVTVGFDGGKTEQADLTKLWDEKNKVIKSATGELTWDYGREVILVQSPKTQAVLGRAGGQTVQLPGVAAAFKTPFVSTIFTPLDDLPLAQSKHILITALAQDKQTGTKYNAAGTMLEATGTAPLLLEPVQATIRLAGAKPAQVRALDHYGQPTGKTVPVAEDGRFAIDGTYRSYYYEVKR
jgi:hypothetical protein